jgi:hypothetical protein
MSTELYKYRIHYLLCQLSAEDYHCARNFLPGHLNISPVTLNSWIYRKMDSAVEIPADALLKLAQFFKVEPLELYEENILTTSEKLHEKIEQFRRKLPFKLSIPR